MRILMWDKIRRELESNAAFNMALLRAIDPRIITHRPRDPEKDLLMKELGMETRSDAIRKVTDKSCRNKKGRKSLLNEVIEFE